MASSGAASHLWLGHGRIVGLLLMLMPGLGSSLAAQVQRGSAPTVKLRLQLIPVTVAILLGRWVLLPRPAHHR